MTATNWAKAFRRSVEQLKNPRRAIHALREKLGDESPSTLFEELSRTQLFRAAVAQNSTPRHFAKVWIGPRLKPCGFAADIKWAAEVMILFQKDIASFLSLERKFDNLYILGDWNDCLLLLDELEKQHGLSLWLISRRLTVLRFIDQSPEEDYAGSLIASVPDGTIVSWLVYIMNYREDPNVTPSTYVRHIQTALKDVRLNPYLAAYLRYNALSAPPRSLDECQLVLAASETAPLIDRYIALLDVLQFASYTFASGENGGKAAISAISRLSAKIDDDRLSILEEVLDPTISGRLVNRLRPRAADAYTEGDYNAAVDQISSELQLDPGRTGLYSLLARAAARTESLPKVPTRIAEILRLMASVHIFADNDESALAMLSHEVLSGAHRSLASSIRALFAGRSEDPSDTVIEIVIEALNGPKLTPLQLRSLPVIDRQGLVTNALTVFPNSTSLKLQLAVLRFGELEIESELRERLPSDRAILYSARALVRLLRYSEAIALLKQLEDSPIAAAANDARRELFLAFTAAGLTRDALRVVAKTHRHNEKLHSMFQLAPLLDKIENSGAQLPFEEISLSICYHIHNRYSGEARMGAQADAAEEYSLSRGVDLPSQIVFDPTDQDAELVPMFLDHVCSSPILDKFMAIETIEEGELERLEICRILSEMEPLHRQRYLDEIREITRRRVVRDRFAQVERTKIYVDTDGVKRQAAKTLRDTYLRFVVALADETQGNERVEMMRRVQRILSDVQADGVKIHFPDLPANERDLLFERLVHQVMRMLISSQEYGLEAYLSTRVRHGTMGNQLRSAFELQHLLTQRDGGYYQPDFFWPEQLDLRWTESGQWLASRLANFSEELDAAIEELVRMRIQVRSEVFADGLFRFQTFNYDTLRLQSEISAETTFDTFMDKVIEQFWTVLEDALVFVRRYIDQDFVNRIYSLTDDLERDLLRELAGRNVSPLRDAIAAARTQMSVNVASVASWFTLARDMEQPDYEFGIAVEVATKSIRVCHPSLGIEVVRTDEVSFDCRGRSLESLVYMLFTALDNAVEHSGFNDRGPSITLETKLEGGWLELRLVNSCAAVDDVVARNTGLQALRARLQSETDVQGLATTEGGSGYAKIIRILRHDLLALYSLEFGYRNKTEYAVTIRIESKAIVK